MQMKSMKCEKILNVWENGDGIINLQIFSDSDHYIAMCREYAFIKAVGSSITNINNGSIYGLMEQEWSPLETRNFGEMLLYFAFKKCIIERPSPYLPKHISRKNPR